MPDIPVIFNITGNCLLCIQQLMTKLKKFCSCFMAWLLKTCLSGFNSNLGLPVEDYILHILTYCSFISLAGFKSYS